ncbi:GNAT family N-acetyltransferase [Rubinisphaera margarita]|uniref:GNAT family N-acetyltransferase n=1 Tax=Rubinisphaera margarita TaxID=2909586 RepID=UPI001EE905FD|nr:GNAT family N-acetyltransferase [Rubinisphaera margarita]MCG6156274.1 GNAT family N-acetyltransferase [Rubinisphaera margarita]
MFQVFEINSIAELQPYRLVWQELWMRGRQQRFQMTLDWLEAYWQARSDDRELKVLFAVLGNKVIGILPLVVKQSATRLGPVRVLTYPLDNLGNWYGPIGPNSAATLAACLRYLSGNRQGWDLLDLPYIDRDRVDLARTATSMRNIGWKPVERAWNQVAGIEFEGTWEEFLGRKRSEVREAVDAADADCRDRGLLRFEHARSDADDPTSQENTERLLQRCLKLADEDSRDVLHSTSLQAAERDCLDVGVLTLDGQPVAGAVSLMHRDGLEVVSLFAEDIAGIPRHSLLSVLMQHLLKASCGLGDSAVEIRMVDRDVEQAAKLWSNHQLRSYRYTTCPLSHVRAALLVNYHAVRAPRLKFTPQRRATVASRPKLKSAPPASEKAPVSAGPGLRIYR